MNTALGRIAAPPAPAVLDGYRGGPPLVDLTVGTPWFGPPAVFREALTVLLAPVTGPQSRVDDRRGHDTYAPPNGAPALRAAIAGLYDHDHGLRVDPDGEVLVTHGATGAVWTTVLTTTDVGDEVLISDPCYTLYEPIVLALGRRAVRVPGDRAYGLLLDPAAVAAAIGPRSRLILLNSPVNPTGSVYDVDRLAGIVEVAAAAGLVTALDEVLDCFCWTRPHTPLLATRRSGVLSINSLSKRLGATGWRLGWLAGDPDLVAAATRLHALQSIAVNHAVQLAAATALVDPERHAVIVRRAAAVHEAGENFVRALARIPGIDPSLAMPDGGLYAFVDVTGLARRHGLTDGAAEADGTTGDGAPCDVAVTTLLRDRCGVAVLPGSAFGPGGAGRIRISLAAHPSALASAARRTADLR